MIDTAGNGTIWHEMLHSCSVSYYDKKIYISNQLIEESSVEFLKRQICKGQEIISTSSYENYTNILQMLNQKFRFGTDMEFAKELFNIPLPERYQWLEDKVDMNLRDAGVSFEDFNDVMQYVQNLKGSKL